MISQLVILAGGKGTRLGSIAQAIPKPLVPVAGKPVLQHQLELAASAGITDVRIFAGHLADQIQSFVGDGSRFGLKVLVEIESAPLGSAARAWASQARLEPEHGAAIPWRESATGDARPATLSGLRR